MTSNNTLGWIGSISFNIAYGPQTLWLSLDFSKLLGAKETLKVVKIKRIAHSYNWRHEQWLNQNHLCSVLGLSVLVFLQYVNYQSGALHPEAVPWWRTQGMISALTLIVTETLLLQICVGGRGLADIAPSPLFLWAWTEWRPHCSMCAKPVAVLITMHVPGHYD